MGVAFADRQCNSLAAPMHGGAGDFCLTKVEKPSYIPGGQGLSPGLGAFGRLFQSDDFPGDPAADLNLTALADLRALETHFACSAR